MSRFGTLRHRLGKFTCCNNDFLDGISRKGCMLFESQCLLHPSAVRRNDDLIPSVAAEACWKVIIAKQENVR